jgi:hypothetical protein
MDGLQSFTPLSGTPGQPGATSEVVFGTGKRQMKMVETIVTRNLPDEFTGTYETATVWNRNANYFTETGPETTHWRQEVEFKASSLFMRLLMMLMPGTFRKQTLKFMQSFKAFAESA